MARYLVTGGCGFIGSHLAEALLRAGHGVRVVDDLSTGRRGNLAEGAELVVGDARDGDLLAHAAEGTDGVFHLAAIASVARCNELWLESHRVNQGATVALLDLARRRPERLPVVFASSAAVYGDQATLPIHEDLPLAPLGPYGADKAGSELHARAAARVHGVRSLGLRFFNVHGPRQRPDDAYAGVITAFAARVRAGQGLTVHGDGLQTRDFVFVRDVAEALLRAMAVLETAAGPCAHVCNVATGVGTTILDLAAAVAELVGRRVPVAHGPERPGDIRHSVGSTARSRELLAFAPATSLRAGLAATLGASPPSPP